MRSRPVGWLAAVVILAACSDAAEPPPTAGNLPPLTTIPSPAATTGPALDQDESIPACERIPFVPSVLPDRVGQERPALSAVEPDRFTAIAGTSSSVWVDDAGDPVVAIVRGSLPPETWTDTPEVIAVRGTDAALGSLSEGVWAVAWFEGDDRCDEYTIALYPPATAGEAQAVAESLVPAGG